MLGIATLHEYQRIHESALKVAEFLALISDRLTPRDLETLRKDDFRAIVELIEASKPSR